LPCPVFEAAARGIKIFQDKANFHFAVGNAYAGGAEMQFLFPMRPETSTVTL
jgi:hypothetical protein